jgi:hypothetical protein
MTYSTCTHLWSTMWQFNTSVQCVTIRTFLLAILKHSANCPLLLPYCVTEHWKLLSLSNCPLYPLTIASPSCLPHTLPWLWQVHFITRIWNAPPVCVLKALSPVDGAIWGDGGTVACQSWRDMTFLVLSPSWNFTSHGMVCRKSNFCSREGGAGGRLWLPEQVQKEVSPVQLLWDLQGSAWCRSFAPTHTPVS